MEEGGIACRQHRFMYFPLSKIKWKGNLTWTIKWAYWRRELNWPNLLAIGCSRNLSPFLAPKPELSWEQVGKWLEEWTEKTAQCPWEDITILLPRVPFTIKLGTLYPYFTYFKCVLNVVFYCSCWLNLKWFYIPFWKERKDGSKYVEERTWLKKKVLRQEMRSSAN